MLRVYVIYLAPSSRNARFLDCRVLTLVHVREFSWLYLRYLCCSVFRALPTRWRLLYMYHSQKNISGQNKARKIGHVPSHCTRC